MNQITVTVELTERNLELLRQLCEPETVLTINPPAFFSEHPVENPFPEPKAEAAPAPAPVNAYTKADVKAVCLKFSQAGRQNELRDAFAKFGAKRLTEISEADYPALMEELGDA